MTITLYGIPNCDTVKRARAWLAAQEIAYIFHNFKKDGIHPEVIEQWLKDIPWGTLINRQGMIWRKLSDQQKALIVDDTSATKIIETLPTIVKRPVLFTGKHSYVGYSDALYHEIFSQ